MKTLTQYREDIKELTAKVNATKTKCTAENRDPVPEEVSHMNDLLQDIEEIGKIVTTIERQERIEARLSGPANVPDSLPGPRKPEERPKDRFSGFGEFAMSVRNAMIPGGHVDPRLIKIHAAASGLNETVPSEGGFLVQKDISQTFMEDLFATNILWNRVGRRVSISGNANGTKVNGFDETSRASSRGGGMISYWVGEAGQGTATKPKFRQIDLTLKKLMGLCYATDENLSDAAQLESVLRNGFNSEFGFKLDDSLINGNGASEPLGILAADCLVSVSKETGQKASTIVAENVIKMFSRMFAGSLSNAIWLINQNTLPQLLTMSIAVGTGGVPVYLPPGNTLIAAPGGALMGRPVYPIEQCASVGTVGDIIFADFTNGYVVAEKGGLKTDMSIHLRFDYDESVFRFILRADGQPIRKTALTPFKGGSTSTQSHFIALETRA